ncbi:hypothetical protein ACOSP7_030411 [Xanthoceras sorbifolium]
MSVFVVSALVFLELLAVATINFSFCNGRITNDYVGCIQTERKALLSFKQDLSDPSNRLASWVGDTDGDGDGNCCKWAGVVCDNFTGHVLELHLRNPLLKYLILDLQNVYTSYFSLEAEYEAYERSLLGGKINPSLLDLKHLIYLDLSGNNFEGIQIPKFLGSMENLRYLNLSNAGLSGMIPHEIGNLSHIRYLDLNLEYQSSTLHVENLFWLSGLSLLEHLDLSGVNLNRASNSLLLMTNMLSSLKVLQLSNCELDHFPSFSMAKFSSLATLDLSRNGFRNHLIPSWIFDLSHLVVLNLAENSFQGSIPEGLQNLTSLTCLDLSSNLFNSSIPEWLYSFTHLEYLSLRYNNLQGRISSGIGNLTSIAQLDLSGNELVGSIPRSFGRLCNLRSISLFGSNLSQEISEILDIFSKCIVNKLESLDMGSSQISGQFTDQLGPFKNLHTFQVTKNSISGPIPSSLLGELSSLKILDVSFNKLNGTLSEIHFTNVTRLLYLDASENPLELTVSLDWIPPFQLEYLYLRSCNLGHGFPLWLHTQKFLLYIDISDSGILDNIPSPFWNVLSHIVFLNLSCNQMYGQIPDLTNAPNLFVLDLSSNNFSGPLPLLNSNVSTAIFSNNNFSGSISQFLCHRTDESKQTEVLKVRFNLLAEELPDCWMIWPSLKILDLGNNKFSGSLPTSIGTLIMLQSLRLRENNLSGTIPVALKNCTELGLLDVSGNGLVGTIPTWIGERFSSMIVLNLRSNKFHGFFPTELCSLASLQILDLADNNLFGAIPRCINNISAMVTIRFTGNDVRFDTNFTHTIEDALVVTKGRTLEYSTNLNLVRSIDLSRNNFSGEIPIEVTNLGALWSLNLSYNSFTGKIPENIGAMRLLESVDFFSNQLFGEIPQSISTLTFLSRLNLSNNNLIGKIPLSTQLQSFDPSCFTGNELCGSPLPENCSDTSPTVPDHENGRGNDDEEHEVDWVLYVSMALGFVVGFWSLIGPLIVNRTWRDMYSRFLDRLGDKIGSVVRK